MDLPSRCLITLACFVLIVSLEGLPSTTPKTGDTAASNSTIRDSNRTPKNASQPIAGGDGDNSTSPETTTNNATVEITLTTDGATWGVSSTQEVTSQEYTTQEPDIPITTHTDNPSDVTQTAIVTIGTTVGSTSPKVTMTTSTESPTVQTTPTGATSPTTAAAQTSPSVSTHTKPELSTHTKPELSTHTKPELSTHKPELSSSQPDLSTAAPSDSSPGTIGSSLTPLPITSLPADSVPDTGGAPADLTAKLAVGISIPILFIIGIIIGVFCYKKLKKTGRGYITLDDFGALEGLQNPNYDDGL